MGKIITENQQIIIYQDNDSLICIKNKETEIEYSLERPSIEINNNYVEGNNFKFQGISAKRKLKNGGIEYKLKYILPDDSKIELIADLRYFPDSPFVRYRYRLLAEKDIQLTKQNGQDNIYYTGFKEQVSDIEVTEIQFSQYESVAHSFIPNFEKIDENELAEGTNFVGPITLVEGDEYCCLLAYEHGAEYPDSYLFFEASKDNDNLSVGLSARKGNYYQGQIVNRDNYFVSPWFHFALSSGDKESLLKNYRNFFLKYISENLESRKPYIFYNTWNYQERNKYFKDKPYLESMHEDRILKEIDIAHQMGIDVFVIDTGWYNKTGDWIVNDQRFSDNMKKVKKQLDSYGMKLGLWFNPIVAARTSKIYQKHPEYVMSKGGKESYWGKIWETEESYGMCLASDYSNYFIEKLIQLNKELGVTYFKWDAIGQYGCDSADHNHGNLNNTAEERLECYSYQMGLEMIRIVEEVSRQCPEVIVDFDITEGGRFVGLGFLSVGKYFLMNNGPYFKDFDIPEQVSIDPDTINVFFYPGTARSKVCRQGTKYDSFVPSILFLTHFLPDSPKISQLSSLVSLMLGGNGIWGDLLSLSIDDINLFNSVLEKYKQVAESVTRSYPKVKGFIGSSPEIYEKIDYNKLEGMIAFLTRVGGTYVHITDIIDQNKFSHVDGADDFELTADGRLKITVKLNDNESRPVFIFSKNK